VFAGFAASGPIHLPVAIDDAARFEAIFGAALPLVREAGSGATLTAYLAPAVRAFFRNGGQRCWIVRLARGAQANRFAIPGLQRLADDGSLTAAYAVARSEGSWSDGLRVRANLTAAPLVAAFDAQALAVDVVTASPGELAAGDLLRLTWRSGAATTVLFLAVASIATVPPSLAPSSPLASPPASPPSRGSVRVTGRTRWLPAPPPDVAVLPGTPAVERLTFDLTVRAEGQPPLRMAGLGFAPGHRRYWADLPADAELFADPAAALSGLWADAAAPRFPLAGEPGGGIYLPIAMDVFFSPDQAAEPVGATALERDGLAPFDAGLFLDPDLHDASGRDLLERADFIRYRSSDARPLEGIHAALGVEEATLIAVPDAVHRGWFRQAAPPLASPLASSPLAHPEWWRWIDCRHPQPPPPDTPLGAGGFIDCDVTAPVDVPPLTATAPQGGTYDLSWTTASGAIDVLEEATRPDFSDAAAIATGSAGRVTLYGRAAGDYYYRIRRVRGPRTSDWSPAVAVRIAPAADWASVEPADFDQVAASALAFSPLSSSPLAAADASVLVAVHTALLTMCAARGDLVAILSLPAHYDERRAIAHATALAPDPLQALGYGALWHPWLVLRDDDASPLRATPPDGATAGVLAARAIARGAWVAPANEPLRGPVALAPPLAAEMRQALQDAAVNVIRQEPAGFVCLDADTLSRDDEVRPLNVRRLLALLRRAALRVGNSYVFEPHDGAARRAVRRAFESMLETLFFRGAFAGATARAAFQVVTDESLNTPSSTDAGRLIAEIRVAPSRPLSFLTLRLVQAGDAAVVQEAGR
jgi:hypothetical protein